MILVRNIFQAKFGKAGELAEVMKGSVSHATELYGGRARVLTDLGGPFDTVVLEIVVESLGEWERQRGQLFARADFREDFVRGAGLIESGRAEFFTIEKES